MLMAVSCTTKIYVRPHSEPASNLNFAKIYKGEDKEVLTLKTKPVPYFSKKCRLVAGNKN